jgi:hypothetical protein
MNPASIPKPKKAPSRKLRWTLLTLFLLLVLFVSGLWWYTTTDSFQRRVGALVVSTLEDSTGGRVEVGHVSFSLWQLAIEVDNLVIHGTEVPAEMPYLSAAKILLRLSRRPHQPTSTEASQHQQHAGPGHATGPTGQ